MLIGPGRSLLDSIHISGGHIAEASDTGDTIDATGLVVAPGFIDTHFHGALGFDFTANPESIWEVGEWLPSTGVTTFLPSLVSTTFPGYEASIDAIRTGPPVGYSGASPIGLHFEGPWLSPQWRGAHNPELLQDPDAQVALSWVESGLVAVVTIAPELKGAEEVAGILAGGGVNVSAGHTGSTYEMAARALNGPWNSVTHLYNQMSGFEHRSPGMVAAALNAVVPVELIADGLHSHPADLQLAWNVLGPGRTVLVTDAMQATGLGHGTFNLGGLEVTVSDDGPRLADGRLASSTLTMDQAVSNLVKWTSASVEEAILAATATPAARLGLTDRGSLDIGARADLVLLDEAGQVKLTLVGGDIIYEA